MRIKNIVILFVLCIGCRLSAQNVMKVDCYQEGNDIAITYFLDRDASTEVFYSKDGGKTFIGPLKKVVGNIGANAQKGQNKLLWSVLDEVESLQGDNIVFKVSISNPFGIEMVFVEGGTFTLGPSNGESVQVRVSDFYICKYEISQKVWKSVMYTNPSSNRGDDLPVENVSWDYIHMFIERLNEKTGLKYRLPTEAEWEYAAKGGKRQKNSSYVYPGYAYIIPQVACYGNSLSTRSVKEGFPNELGLLNMAGNVAEYCIDGYDSYSDLKTSVNPIGNSKQSLKVLRGGSYKSSKEKCKVISRDFARSDTWSSERGFRLVLEIE